MRRCVIFTIGLLGFSLFWLVFGVACAYSLTLLGAHWVAPKANVWNLIPLWWWLPVLAGLGIGWLGWMYSRRDRLRRERQEDENENCTGRDD